MGRERAIAMHRSFAPTLRLWSSHGDVIGAVIEEMHTTPSVAAVWKATFDRFVSAVAEQIVHERSQGVATDGAPPDMLATVLVCGMERNFYVSSRGLEPRLPTAESAVEALEWLTVTGIYGGRSAKTPHQDNARTRIESRSTGTPPTRPAGSFTAEKSARAILHALRTLLSDFSIDKLSVARIAKEAGVSRSTFYFYFESKDSAFAALYQDLADTVGAALHRLHSIDRSDADQLADVLYGWLRIDDHTVAIMRNALHQWPRTPRLRSVYHEGMSEQTASLEAIINQDRLSGLAPDGPPASQLAAVLLWTVERSVAGALAGEDHLIDLDLVVPCLSRLVVAAIYGS